jgi:hypothetical protein
MNQFMSLLNAFRGQLLHVCADFDVSYASESDINTYRKVPIERTVPPSREGFAIRITKA